MAAKSKGIPLFHGEKYRDTIWGARVLFYRGQILRGIAVLFFVLLSAVTLRSPDVQWIGIISVVMVLALVIVMLEKRSTYYYNRCILTDRRIIDIRRRHLLGRAMRTVTQYDTIREVNVNANFFERLFHIGTVDIVVTLPTLHEMCLGCVDDPEDKQTEILELRNRFIR